MARGITGRIPGDIYVNTSNPSDVLTIQEINTYPAVGSAFNTVDELNSFLDENVVDFKPDNKPTIASKAAIVVNVTDSSGNVQNHVRYIQKIPSNGCHGMWATINGYKYGKSAITESVPIKPSDLILDERFMTAKTLSTQLVNAVDKHDGIDDDIKQIIKTAIYDAQSPDSIHIPNGAKYANVIEKYAGEYLGPLALMASGKCGGDTQSMMKSLGIDTFNNSKVMFPQDTSFELYDSIIKLQSNKTINISSKIHTSGGAASSLSGVVKRLTPEICQKYPMGTNIMKLLGTQSAIEGPLKVAIMLNILKEDDASVLREIDRSSRNIEILQTSSTLYKLTKEQFVKDNTRGDYRVFYHAMAAVVNKMTETVNMMDEFTSAMSDTLANNDFVQIVTKAKKIGNDITLEFYTKFPLTFSGKPQLVNKTFFATGQKGRIGFKLKN